MRPSRERLDGLTDGPRCSLACSPASFSLCPHVFCVVRVPILRNISSLIIMYNIVFTTPLVYTVTGLLWVWQHKVVVSLKPEVLVNCKRHLNFDLNTLCQLTDYIPDSVFTGIMIWKWTVLESLSDLLLVVTVHRQLKLPCTQLFHQRVCVLCTGTWFWHLLLTWHFFMRCTGLIICQVCCELCF